MIEFDKLQDFPDGVALVFGGSGGLGQSIARLLAARGAQVAVTYRSRKDEADKVVGQIEAHGGSAIALRADMTDADSVRAAVEEAVKRYGRIHTVVTGQGLSFCTDNVGELSPQDFRNVIETDVIGFFNVAQATLPLMRKSGGSYVGLVTTGIGRTHAGDALSCVPKAALAMMLKEIAVEEAQYGIRANGVGPGVIMAGMVLPMYETDAKVFLDQAVAVTPLKRAGTDLEIAEAVVFLASRRASYITGNMLMVDGGLAA